MQLPAGSPTLEHGTRSSTLRLYSFAGLANSLEGMLDTCQTLSLAVEALQHASSGYNIKHQYNITSQQSEIDGCDVMLTSMRLKIEHHDVM